jgi:gas vesicle protein
LSLLVEQHIRRFLEPVLRNLNTEVQEATEQLMRALAQLDESLFRIRLGDLSLDRSDLLPFDANDLGYVIAGIGIGGAGMAGIGAAIGGLAFHWTGPGAAIGAGVGALVGFFAGGWIAKTSIGRSLMRKKLNNQVKDTVKAVLRTGIEDPKGKRQESILENLKSQARELRKTIGEGLRRWIDSRVATIQSEIDTLLARKDEIRAQSKSVISRLDPLVAEADRLLATGRKLLKES